MSFAQAYTVNELLIKVNKGKGEEDEKLPV
jgi:hypothetical protein